MICLTESEFYRVAFRHAHFRKLSRHFLFFRIHTLITFQYASISYRPLSIRSSDKKLQNVYSEKPQPHSCRHLCTVFGCRNYFNILIVMYSLSADDRNARCALALFTLRMLNETFVCNVPRFSLWTVTRGGGGAGSIASQSMWDISGTGESFSATASCFPC
jgi:hypothetical protein